MDMNTKRIKKFIGIVIMFLIMIIPTGFVYIHDIFAESSSVETDEQIDLTLGAIEALDSVNNIPDLIFVMETLLRVPISQIKDGEPPYNQEPPDAQQDFRRPTNMPPTMTPPTQNPPTMAPPTMQPPTMMPPPTIRPTRLPPPQPPLPPTMMPPPTMPPTMRPFPPSPLPTRPPPPPTMMPPPPTQDPNDDVPNPNN